MAQLDRFQHESRFKHNIASGDAARLLFGSNSYAKMAMGNVAR
jgi:hypothetical protein